MDYITNEEIWKPVKDFEGRYEVSNFGRVKSLDRKVKRLDVKGRPSFVTVKGRILKPNTDIVATSGGYPTVKLMKDNKGKTVRVHRLVASAFIDNPSNLPEVNHKDEDKTNNHVNNLEWCTSKQNNEHGTRKKRIYSHPNFKKMAKQMGESRRKPVKATNIKTGETKIYESTLSAEKDGFDNANISRVCLGKQRTHKGYTWEYI